MKFKDKYFLISIFFAALIIRLAFVLPSNAIPSSDAYVYDRLGFSVSQGRGYVENNGTAHAFYPPFYPLFLSAIYAVFGHSYIAVRIAQSIIGALTCVLIYLIGKRAGNAVLGIITASISIVYFPFIKSAELLLTELLFTFLLCLIVYYLFKIREDTRLKNYIILGLLLGSALLTKPVMLLFPFFIMPIFFYSKKNNIFDIFKKYTVVLLFCSLLVLPWITRNYIVYHKFGIISTQTGITFYSSYRPPEGIFGKFATEEDPVIIEASKISSPVLYSDFLVKKTLEFITHNPAEILILEFKKILYLWAPFDWEIVGGRWFNFIYAALLPFFALGFVLSLKEFKRFYPVLLPIGYFQIMTLLFYGSPRFRLPIEPYIFILSTIGIIVCWKWISKNIISGSA